MEKDYYEQYCIDSTQAEDFYEIWEKTRPCTPSDHPDEMAAYVAGFVQAKEDHRRIHESPKRSEPHGHIGTVCPSGTPGIPLTDEEKKGHATAPLIAAAPDLLEACKELIRRFAGPRDTMDSIQEDVFDAARAAIRKAEGA